MSSWDDRNKEKVKEIKRNWALNNKEKRLESCRKYRETNKDKVALTKLNSNRKHAKKCYARKKAYEYSKEQRTPSWLSTELKHEMEKIYMLCPVGYEVDHIVPLNGENVSGLHVPWNLQYLTKLDNIKKSNKYE